MRKNWSSFLKQIHTWQKRSDTSLNYIFLIMPIKPACMYVSRKHVGKGQINVPHEVFQMAQVWIHELPMSRKNTIAYPHSGR